MSLRLLSLLMLLLSPGPLLADGFPFDPRTQRLHVPCISLQLKQPQVLEVASTGTITFNEEQLQILRSFYPAMTNRADVIVATYRDLKKGLPKQEVYCFWVAPKEVAVTINMNLPKDRPPFTRPVNDKDTPQEKPGSLRLDPYGVIYYQGKEITLKQACALIDAMADRSGQNKQATERCLKLIMAPPVSGLDVYRIDRNKNLPAELYQALKIYGKARSVLVEKHY